jgi:hypothetical protein
MITRRSNINIAGGIVRSLLLGVFVALFTVHDGYAGEITDVVEVESRLFPQTRLDNRQHGNNLSLGIEFEYFHDWQDGDQRFVLMPYFRLDQGDGNRTHLDIRELYWRKSFDSADLYIGIRKVFWGVTETLHLIDIVNQTDLVENLDTEDKLGQPMVNLTLIRDWGTLDLFLLPYFRERLFPGIAGRLRPFVSVATGQTVYESDAEQFRPDFAVRWSHIVGDFDLGVGHFYGTSREPRLMPAINLTGPPVLIPHYDLLNQASLDLQYFRGDWLWKMEGVFRDGIEGRSAAAVGGFEYTIVGLLGSDYNLGIVTEYQFDNRGGPFVPIGNNDLATGARLTFNDVQDTDLLAFMVQDMENQTRFASIEANRRLSGNREVTLEARFFMNTAVNTPLRSLRRDDYFQVMFTQFF